jgi:hypothetical protein
VDGGGGEGEGEGHHVDGEGVGDEKCNFRISEDRSWLVALM